MPPNRCKEGTIASEYAARAELLAIGSAATLVSLQDDQVSRSPSYNPTQYRHHQEHKMMKHPISKGPRSFTPLMRRFLRDIFKPTVALGKRRTRDENQENHPPVDWTPTKPKPNCVALQNEDEDAVVITALNEVPFCCHADLLIMTHPQLVATARALNAKLPKALHIDDTHTDAFIRHSIELLVGIRSDEPRAPKRRRSLSLDTSDVDASAEHSTTSTVLPPSPVSPLAVRNRSDAAGSVASRSMLASLREEPDEDKEADRPNKRRRMEEEEDTSRDGTPTRRYRPHARRSEPSSVQSPAPGTGAHRLNRSQSHRLPGREPAFPGLHRNITVARPGRRLRSQSAVLTSTPRVHRWVPKLAAAGAASGSGTAGEDSLSSPSSGISAVTTASQDSLDPIERVSGWLEGSVVQDVQGVVTELEGLSLGLSASESSSDMDVSF